MVDRRDQRRRGGHTAAVEVDCDRDQREVQHAAAVEVDCGRDQREVRHAAAAVGILLLAHHGGSGFGGGCGHAGNPFRSEKIL